MLAVEWDNNSVATYKQNFPSTPIYHGDIASLSVDECCKLANIRPGELDILDGSPPCQGFSVVGKRNVDDPRNQLYKEFVRLLKGLQPKVFVMENVKGLTIGNMKPIFESIKKELRECGYVVDAQVLNAMHYGVPQSRQRVIFIGVREDLGYTPSYPEPLDRLITVREALEGLTEFDQFGRKCSELKLRRWHETEPGHTHHKRFTLYRCSWDKPTQAILSTCGGGGCMHPDEPRLMHVGELRRLATYPDTFKFVGSWNLALKRIGNSVPPEFMRRIAEHIRKNILGRSSEADT